MSWDENIEFLLSELHIPSHPQNKVTRDCGQDVGKLGGKWGLGERRGFTQSPLIPKPLGGGNTLGVNKA